jgi:hypothetical protein
LTPSFLKPREIAIGGGDGLEDAGARQQYGQVGAPGREDVVADDDVVFGEQLVDGDAAGGLLQIRAQETEGAR